MHESLLAFREKAKIKASVCIVEIIIIGPVTLGVVPGEPLGNTYA